MNKFEKILKWIVIIGVCLIPITPLLIADTLYFPYIVGKNIYFRSIVSLIFIAWGTLIFVAPAYRPRKSLVLLTTSVFVLLVLVADIFSVDPLKSFWSNFERMDGFITLAYLWVYFLILISVFKDKKLWGILASVSLIVSVIVSFYGLAQIAGRLGISQGGVRLDATFGNAIYLAVYLLFHIFIAGLIFIHTRRLWVRWLLAILAILEGFILLKTASRGVALGLFLSIILMTLLSLVVYRKNKIALSISLGVLISIVLVGGTFFAIKDSQFVQESPVLSRFANVSLTEGTVASRFEIWDIAWQGIKEKPILGWGQGNFMLVFAKYYEPNMFEQEPWFDRTHNIVFDWLIAGGFLSLLAYFAVIVSLYIILWKAPSISPKEKIILSGLVFAYVFQNLFVFDNIVSYILFFSIIAYIHTQGTKHKKEVFGGHRLLFGDKYFLVLPVTAFVGLGSLYCFALQPMWSGSVLIQAMQLPIVETFEQGGNKHLQKNIEYFEEAIHKSPTASIEAREQLSQTAINVWRIPEVSPEVKEKFVQKSIEEWQMHFSQRAPNARDYTIAGSLFASIGDLKTAEDLYSIALDLSPKNQRIMTQLGWIYILQDKESFSLFEEMYNLAPQFDQSKMWYALSAIRVGDTDLAFKIIDEVNNIDVFRNSFFINTLRDLNRQDILIEIFSERLADKLKTVDDYERLVVLYLEKGNRTKALEVAQKILEIDSSNKQKWEYIVSEIKAGRNPIE